MAYLKITLKSDLCAASGESAGNSIDTDFVSDANGLPYIPARRLKGCLRQSAESLLEMGLPGLTEELITELFGDAFGKEGAIVVNDGKIINAETMGAKLQEIRNSNDVAVSLKNVAHPESMIRLFSQVRGQTKMENGVKVDNSLRFTRVLNHYNPLSMSEEELEFYAPVYINDDKYETMVGSIAKATRHIGFNRNRGLGNVEIVYVTDKPDKQTTTENPIKDGRVRIEYKVSFESDIALYGSDDHSRIPARSAIGCMAAEYLKTGDADEPAFKALFLDGSVSWSDITPVIGGKVSSAIPGYLMKLKNGNNRIINRFLEKDDAWKRLKPKTIGEGFAVSTEEGIKIASPEYHTLYHNGVVNRNSEGGLYMQDSLEAGMIYGGYAECPAEYVEKILALLERANFRFGRSKSAQYSSCKLYGTPKVCAVEDRYTDTVAGEPVYVVLESDMIVCSEGLYLTENCALRNYMAQHLGLADELPDNGMDICSYGIAGGYQSTWQLQKMQIPTVKAGSVYCFKSLGGKIPEYAYIGEYKQEGMGRCHILTEKTMSSFGEAKTSSVDRKQVHIDAQSGNVIQSGLLIAAGKEAYAAFARKKADEMTLALGKEKFPIGRIRVMTEEATGLDDLRERVASIKESDLSSEKEKSRKEWATELLADMYGSQQEGIRNMLGTEDAKLAEMIWNDETAKAVLLSEWKRPLLLCLHYMYFRKGEK